MKALFVGGQYNGKIVDVEEIYKTMWNGKLTMDWSEERKNGGCVPREELDRQPKVDGYLSPMWDSGMLRYETQDVYNMLSC